MIDEEKYSRQKGGERREGARILRILREVTETSTCRSRCYGVGGRRERRKKKKKKRDARPSRSPRVP